MDYAQVNLLTSFAIPARYGTGTECDSDCTGTVADQLYLNTTITLREADTSFGDTIATGAGATYTGLTSSEGGKVWNIATISIPAMGSQTAVASSTASVATHATPTPSAAGIVSADEATDPTAGSAAQESGSVPSVAPSVAGSGAAPSQSSSGPGFRSGSGSGFGSAPFPSGSAPGSQSNPQSGAQSGSKAGSGSAPGDDNEPCPEW